MLNANCPSCGAGISFVNKASLVTVCVYCSVTVLRENLNLRSLGKTAELLDDGTVIRIGTEGQWGERKFVVVGRVQRSYPKGFWNDWYVTFDRGEGAWLSEAMGFYSLLSPAQVEPGVPPLDAVILGLQVKIGSKAHHVRSILAGECAGIEGELPFVQEAHKHGTFVDLTGPEEHCATISYLPDTTRVLAGRYIPFDDLAFKNLRAPEGW